MALLNDIEIGNRLKIKRERLSLSAREFSEKAGIDQSQYSKIEKGKIALSDNIWDKIERTFKFNKEEILLGTIVPQETLENKSTSGRLDTLIVQLMEQQNRLIEKQNSILERQNAEVMDKLDALQKEAALKGDVVLLKKDLTRQLSEISSQMNDGISSVLEGLKPLKSSGQKELAQAGKSSKR